MCVCVCLCVRVYVCMYACIYRFRWNADNHSFILDDRATKMGVKLYRDMVNLGTQFTCFTGPTITIQKQKARRLARSATDI